MFESLILVGTYGYAAQAKPRCSTPSNQGRERLDEMNPWDLCFGSTGRAQRSRVLPESALAHLT